MSRYKPWLLGSLLFASVSVVAQPQLSPSQFLQMQALNEALVQENTEEALTLGQELYATAGGTPEVRAYVRAYAARALAQIYQQQDRLPEAVRLLETSLTEDNEHLDVETRQVLRWMLVQFHIGLGEYEQSLAYLESWWQEAEAPDAQAWYLYAALLAHLERWADAEPYLLRAMALAESIPDSWYGLGVAIYQRQERWPEAADMQERRLNQSPDVARNWTLLAQLQRLAERDAAALVTLELAQRKGFLTLQEQRQLGRLLLQAEQPLRAARVFDQILDDDEAREEDYRLAAQAWMQTGLPEDIPVSLQRLAEHTGKQQDWRRLGDWYFNEGQWLNAIEAWQRIRNQLDAEAQASLDLLIANAYIEQGLYSEARQVLDPLLEGPREDAARQWINYLNAL